MSRAGLILKLRSVTIGVLPAALCEEAADEIERLVSALRGIMEHDSIDLGDLVYTVRERDGLGWDGPLVKSWSDAVSRANNVLSGSA